MAKGGCKKEVEQIMYSQLVLSIAYSTFKVCGTLALKGGPNVGASTSILTGI